MRAGIARGDSMVDPAAAKTADLLHAQRCFLAALAPEPGTAHHAPIAFAPLVRTAALASGATKALARQASLTLHAGAALPVLAADPTAWTEAFSIAGAIARQWQGLQAQWLQGWTELAKEASEWRPPNTVSKLACQEADLVGRAMSLVSAQATSTIRAQEDILVGVSWWMSRRAGQVPAGRELAAVPADPSKQESLLPGRNSAKTSNAEERSKPETRDARS